MRIVLVSQSIGGSVVVAAVALAALAGCGGPSEPRTLGCGVAYPPQSTSPYVLPYPVGTSFVVGQGNCSPGGSHSPGTVVQFAYDFLMPIGSSVVASRDGTVLLVEDRFEDATRRAGEENFINVVHADGSIAAYVHLTRDGALVAVGDSVRRGQTIGLSGDSGDSSAPHLHFHVLNCDGCPTGPVSFRNTRPHPNGLVVGETYLAEPYQE